jgi:hypothetical protein
MTRPPRPRSSACSGTNSGSRWARMTAPSSSSPATVRPTGCVPVRRRGT